MRDFKSMILADSGWILIWCNGVTVGKMQHLDNLTVCMCQITVQSRLDASLHAEILRAKHKVAPMSEHQACMLH
jgi:hypothetical protein